eukprot:gene26771-35092_t
MVLAEESHIKVGVLIKALAEGGTSAIRVCDDKTTVAVETKKKNQTSFTAKYNRVFEFEGSEVYEELCKPLIKDSFKGINGILMAYGQTGSGKTYAMSRILELALQEIFQMKEVDEQNGSNVRISVSYLEVFKDQCLDNFNKKAQLIKNSKVFDSATERNAETYAEAIKFLNDGTQVRITKKTSMNANSSRSHAIATIYVRATYPMMETLTSKLHFIDLAGSERTKKSKTSGARLKEGIAINKSLLVLGNVMNALAENDPSKVVPYKESTLTRILQGSLGGNSNTLLLACVSPMIGDQQETKSTLEFAKRALKVSNRATVNIESDSVQDLAMAQKEIARLKAENRRLKAQLDNQANKMEDNASSSDSNPELDSDQIQAAMRELKLEITTLQLEQWELRDLIEKSNKDKENQLPHQLGSVNVSMEESNEKAVTKNEQQLHKISNLLMEK